MAFPNTGSSFMLLHAGVACSATLQGLPTNFNGILDTGTRVEFDAGSRELTPTGTTLVVYTSIAVKMVENNTTLLADGVQYIVDRIMKEDDGFFTTLYITQVTS
jgi:hypothetical protein